jgi:diguanylate cyclase (GGDEF)-like protein/PAS domain S-box-containing protein
MFNLNPPALSAPIKHALPEGMTTQVMDRKIGTNIAVVGADLRLHYANEGFARALASTPEALIGRELSDIYTPQHLNGFLPYLHRALGGELVTYERRIPVVGSEDVWYTVSFTPWQDKTGATIGVTMCSMKVHELKTTSEALRKASERLSSHMENSPLAVFELDAQLKVTHCSARVETLFGIEPQRLIGHSLLAELDMVDVHAPLVEAFLRLTTGVESSNRAEATLTHRDGRTVYCDWFNSALTDSSGRVQSIMALVQDISAREEAAQQLLHIATHDNLTGLGNRRMLTERLSHSLERAKRTGDAVALLFIDLDGFKHVNDAYGHGAGDEVLKTVAQRLKGAARACDFLARLGGDEFVILMDTDVVAAAPGLLSERIFAALSEPCRFEGGEGKVGASIGVAMHPPLSNLAADLIRRADAAMYEAKTAGKGRVRYAAE